LEKTEKSVRLQRVGRELHHLVAEYVQHEIADSMPNMVSVTAVDVMADLRKAAVYFRLVGTEKGAEQSEEILEHHRRNIQAQVAKKLLLKFCPVLEFRYGKARQEDDVDRLLAQLGKRKSQWD
jgi:ribosome-binding factor A